MGTPLQGQDRRLHQMQLHFKAAVKAQVQKQHKQQ